ncbi:kynurenine 3-monooxygenase [Pustulibacterium marinum]|uniref:Kynurenine 3-monooxygenase n=1 Tax=Pustulibacterium marinum TaxID=1224947 RepID=A0A1I7F9A5_9FLAO|nr:NAD(P)/FAD-dependent oxidoreductase [Pustulibacterium marinum]SFU32709.1 kynurenine 3-monooxygenase [Pustulibacterium marinum]
MQTPKNIAVVGSGLVGSLLAIYLVKRGHKVDVYDRRSDIRKIEFSGRSINLAMSVRGWHALDEVGVGDAIRKIAIPLYKRAIHTLDKPMYFQPYGKENEAIYSISRGALNKMMIDLAEEAGATFIFDQKIWDVDLAEATLYAGSADKSERKAYKYDLVFGADGAFSRVRHKMQRRSMFNYSQEFLETGYKELTIPANEDGSHKLDKNSFHIWPRGEFMFIAMPNTDGSFTCTLFMPYKGINSFEALDTEEKVHAFFEEHFPVILEDIPNLVKDFFNHPTSSLVTIKCFPWTYWDKVALIGDAAHAIVPFYGQGMNVGFEDITELDGLIDQFGDDWEAIFNAYETSRKPNADAIAELSFRNFMEMSTKTADASFILRKKIEAKFFNEYPDQWVPLYSRVTFSRKPYAEALEQGDKQRAIMDEVMKMPNIHDNWESEAVTQRILELLSA